MKTALICGVGGQDGAFLARHLLRNKYTVYGTSRDAQGGGFSNLERLEIHDSVRLISMAPEDFRSVFMAIKASEPDEVYFLAGQSSVGLSFEQPAETMQSFILGTLNILEACRMFNPSIRHYHAGSSECFGDTSGIPARESTPFFPRSPYAVAKATFVKNTALALYRAWRLDSLTRLFFQIHLFGSVVFVSLWSFPVAAYRLSDLFLFAGVLLCGRLASCVSPGVYQVCLPLYAAMFLGYTIFYSSLIAAS